MNTSNSRFFLLLTLVLCSLLLTAGCMSYYGKNIAYQNAVEEGNFEKADQALQKLNFAKKDYLLENLEKAWIQWIFQSSILSNTYFSKADSICEYYKINPLQQAAALLSNENVKNYSPEDFEIVFINYFKSLNYIRMNEYSSALVEARKINEKLYKLNDKYSQHKNRFRDDAFSHIMIGLIYEANKQYNDAFIAYRNALKVYKEIYLENFNMEIPETLKQDILRTAYQTGFYEEVRFYEKEFGINYQAKKQNDKAELIVLWHNGLSPVKQSASFTFVNGGSMLPGGMMNFSCPEANLSLPLFIGNYSSNEIQEFSSIQSLRLAFPVYVERPPTYIGGRIIHQENVYSLDLAENINAIAFKTLEDRMAREVGTTLLRLLVKKGLEHGVRAADENVGAILGLINTFTEQADTRSWQSLPHSIYYARIPLAEGEQRLKFEAFTPKGEIKSAEIKMNVSAGKLYFYSFQTTDSQVK